MATKSGVLEGTGGRLEKRAHMNPRPLETFVRLREGMGSAC